jgi:hypothetical protein
MTAEGPFVTKTGKILTDQDIEAFAEEDEYKETCIIITPPDNWLGSQVLVRLPGHIDPATVQVDFRPDPSGVWTPSSFFEDSLVVRHQ